MNQAHLPFGPRWFRPSPSPWEQQRQASDEWLREFQRKREDDRRGMEETWRKICEKAGCPYKPLFPSDGTPAPTPGALPVTESMRLLGLTHPFTRDDVARAWKLRAAAAHPDRGGSAEEFVMVTQARDELLRGLGVYA